MFNTPIEVGNVALSASLLLSAFGVLAGGVMVTRVRNHRAFAAFGLFVAGLTILLAGMLDWGSLVLITAHEPERLCRRPDHALARPAWCVR